VVDAFLAAAREGDFAGLLAVLHPDVELRTDDGALRPGTLVRGAAEVAKGAIAYTKLAAAGRPVLINGAPGLVSYDAAGHPKSLMSFTVAGDRIVAMYALTDPSRLGAVPPA
jgi:RNA polymerase sigma-70 factor (ECF subfamily)